MDCAHTQTWLLQTDTLHPECWPSELAEHVRQCGDCAQLARDLRQLEDDWRHIPIPVRAEQAQTAFLQKLPALQAELKPARNRWRPHVRWAAAAMIFFGVGAAVWVIVTPNVQASHADIVERLIDFHLELTETVDLAERRRLLSEREDGFLQDILKARITPEDRELAQKLLEDGKKLAEHYDPLEEAGRFSDIADKFVGRIETATKMGNVEDTERNAKCYKNMEFGMHKSMERAAQLKPKEMEKSPGYEQIQKRDEWQKQQMEKIAERARPDLRKVLESVHRQFHGGPPFRGGMPMQAFKK